MKKNKTILILIFAMLLAVSTVSSDPPTPKNVKGFVLNSGGSGMPNGIPVRIINLNTSQIVNTEVFAPPVRPGAYSATIDASIGDSLTIRAWNASTYGETNTTAQAGTTDANVTMNITRPSETNVTILSPTNNTAFNGSVVFNVTANVTIIGGQDATGCEAQVQFGNSSVVNVITSNTNNLGNLVLGSTTTTSFEVVGLALGSTNIIVNSSCDTDDVNFAGLDSFTVHNITIVDEAPPVINLVSPANNSLNLTTSDVVFRYNVSDFLSVENCSLLINGTINQTTTTIVKDIEQNFSINLVNGNYLWNVTCFDALGNQGFSDAYNLTIEVFFPNVTTTIEPVFTLTAGSTTEIRCNVSVEDGNGAGNIDLVNATFYHNTSSSDSPDNDNDHYTNSSCSLVSGAGSQGNYTCAFNLNYYANSGNWTCNATATDFEDHLDSRINQTLINDLFALNTSTNTIDYGEASITEVSQEVTVNITNIGNQPINISVYGFGGNDPVSGNGLAMVCPGNNITIAYEKFFRNSVQYNSKTNLTSSNQPLEYTLPKQTTASLIQNSSFWQISVPVLNPPIGQGICNGSVVFHAETA